MLVALSIAPYLNSLQGAFVWDDLFQIERNSSFRNVGNLLSSFSSGQINYYRPTQTVFYGVAYWIGGVSPVYYHAINVVLHSVATVFAYLLCIELSIPVTAALLIGAIFASHPVHTEAVAWIAAVNEVASGAFYFASLWAFAKFLQLRFKRWLWLSTGLFWVALLSKEMAITMPLFAVGLVLLQSRYGETTSKDVVRRMWPYAAAIVCYLLLRFHAIGFTTSSSLDMPAGSMDWITLGFEVFALYLRYVCFPHPLVAYHLIPLHLPDRLLRTLFSAFVISALPLLVWTYRHRRPYAMHWLGLFVITLIPLFYFKAIHGPFFSERYLYTPSLPAIVLIVLALWRLGPKRATVICSVIVGVFCLLTFVRNLAWRDNSTLYTRTVERNPAAAAFWSGLGIEQLDRGNVDLAQQYYEMALRQASDRRYVQLPDEFYRIHVGLGVIAARRKDFGTARSHFDQAMKANPVGSLAYAYLGGVVLEQDGNYSEAVKLFQRALDLNPFDDIALDFMGLAMFNQGRTQDAVRYFKQALHINPRLKEAQEHLKVATDNLK